MNPGDVYNPNLNSPDRRDPYAASRTHNGAQPPFPPQHLPQPAFPPPNPYDNLAPASSPRPFPQSQSTPYMSQHQQQGQAPPYADPFHDNSGPPPMQQPADQWSNLPGSRHHASYPILPSSPPPQGNPYQPRPSLPAQPMSMSPTGPQHLVPPNMDTPPRTRFDSNVSYQSANSFPASHNSQPYGLADDRLTSPPPLLPQHSSTSSIGYPPHPFPMQHSNSNQYGQQDDDMDSAPLLNHATADPRFGGPPRGGTPARFQLQDGGDVGVLPNRWRHDSGMGSGSQVGQPFSYGLGGGQEPPPDDSNVHYGPLPTRVLRRNRTQKKVNLFHGHLVLDVEVPSMYMDKVPQRDELEFSKMRYTAITCDPNDFVDDRYTLRQKLYDPPRQTELFIVVTMYNEDDLLFCRTMRGVFQNIAHLCTRTKSKTWGKEGWKKVVVCVVADGRLKINPRTRSVLAALGVYQDGVGTNNVNGKPVTAHLYEYTTQLWIDSGNKLQPPDPSRHVPVQIIFCMKEKNQKKINSHRWFFNAFGACLRPNVCVLLDVGTQPGPDSIYHLWKAFDINSSVGGACGEIVALKGMFWRNLLNPLVAAQNFEYKMSNILDKPLESIFGYITVLPGAFSAYRYIALLNDDKGNGPLKQYFLGETMHGSDAGIFAANMYLAEDRILCWELVSKRGCKWILHYVKSAYAITDVPDRVPELVSQRRRWLNGSFFAAIHSTFHFGYLYRSSHSFTRKFFLHIEFLYQFISLFFSWFALGNFFIAFVVLTNSLNPLGAAWKYVNIPLQYGYAALLLLCFLLALGNRPAGSVVGYTVSMIGFALLTVYMLFAAVYLAVLGIQDVTQQGITADTVFGNPIFRNIVLSLLATYGLYIIASLLALEPWHMVTSFLQYLLLAPSYINVLNVYAFSNVHDVSWGTKGSDKASEDLGVVKSDDKNEVTVMVPTEQKDLNALYENEMSIINSKPPKEETKIAPEQKQEDYYKNFRTNVLLAWTMSNAALAAVILQTSSGSGSVATTYMGVLLYTVAGLAFFRFVGSTAYLIVRLFVGE